MKNNQSCSLEVKKVHLGALVRVSILVDDRVDHGPERDWALETCEALHTAEVALATANCRAGRKDSARMRLQFPQQSVLFTLVKSMKRSDVRCIFKPKSMSTRAGDHRRGLRVSAGCGGRKKAQGTREEGG